MVWCGIVCCGVVWCGVVWCGVVWCGVVWCSVVWCGKVYCDAKFRLKPTAQRFSVGSSPAECIGVVGRKLFVLAMKGPVVELLIE